jgi:hypothetical protein
MSAQNYLYRDVTCAAAAIVITLALGMSFVHSTADRPGTESVAMPTLTLQIPNGWFGQPQPAVLVD